MKRIRRGVFVDPSHRFPNVLNEVLIMLDTVKSSVQLKDMSEIIGPMPQIAPKKHCAPRCGKVERGAAEDR